VASLLTVFVGVAPAHAATSSGTITVKRSGATNFGEIAGNAAGPGATASFQVRVTNTGSTLDQLVVRATYFDNFTAPMVVTQGSSDITALVNSSAGYVTPGLAPGQSVVLTAVRHVDPDTMPGAASFDQVLFSLFSRSGGSSLGTATAIVFSPVTSVGPSSSDLFVKSGLRQFAPKGAVSDAPTKGASATFTLRLQNDGTTPNAVALKSLYPNLCQWIYVIKNGYKDVTAAVAAGTYVTPILKPGTHHDLTVKVTNTGPPSCQDNNQTVGIEFAAKVGQDGSFSDTPSMTLIIPHPV
jgi:hypothetical protein